MAGGFKKQGRHQQATSKKINSHGPYNRLTFIFFNRATTKRVERMSHTCKKDGKKKQATKQQEHSKQQLHHSKPHEFSLSAGELKDINYYLREDLDNSSDSSDFDDYEIGPSIFPSKKKQTEIEYSNKKKDTKELKKEAKKRALKREMYDKKKTLQLKTEEEETPSPHMSFSSYDRYNDDDEYDMKVDVDILNESLGQSTSSFSKLYLSNRSLSDGPPAVVARTSSTEKMKKLFKGMKRRLSMNN